MEESIGGADKGVSAPRVFASPEVASFWTYIARSLDRLMTLLDGCTIEQLNYVPPARNANSLHVLGVHTLSNARENILGVLCGKPVDRTREEEFTAVAREGSVPIPWWPQLRDALEQALSMVSSRDLDRAFSHPRRDQLTGRELLIVVARHAAEHLGQAELTRDMVMATPGTAQ